jgi:hypothetical protein
LRHFVIFGVFVLGILFLFFVLESSAAHKKTRAN